MSQSQLPHLVRSMLAIDPVRHLGQVSHYVHRHHGLPGQVHQAGSGGHTSSRVSLVLSDGAHFTSRLQSPVDGVHQVQGLDHVGDEVRRPRAASYCLGHPGLSNCV